MKHGDKNNYYDEKVASATQRSVSLAPWHETCYRDWDLGWLLVQECDIDGRSFRCGMNCESQQGDANVNNYQFDLQKAVFEFISGFLFSLTLV